MLLKRTLVLGIFAYLEGLMLLRRKLFLGERAKCDADEKDLCINYKRRNAKATPALLKKGCIIYFIISLRRIAYIKSVDIEMQIYFLAQ